MKHRARAVVAALAAGLAASAALSVAATSAASASTTTGWNLVFQSRSSGLFESIAAISPRNVWAVGDFIRGRQTIYRPLIEHFTGRVWKAGTIPGARMTSDTVQATSASDVWIFGHTPNKMDVTASAAYRWDGAHWHKVPVPAYTYLQGTVVLGRSNVWAFGGSETLSGDVFHWDGRRWESYNLNFFPQAISASSAGNVWLTGMTWSRKGEKATAYRWNGKRWRAVASPHPIVDVGPGVTALSGSNVWIGWQTTTTTYAAHWNGRYWRTIAAPGNVEANSSDIVPDGRGGYWFGPLAYWTGRAWINAGEISPDFSAAGFGSIVRIPGTSSFLMGGGTENPGSSAEHPTIYRFEHVLGR